MDTVRLPPSSLYIEDDLQALKSMRQVLAVDVKQEISSQILDPRFTNLPHHMKTLWKQASVNDLSLCASVIYKLLDNKLPIDVYACHDYVLLLLFTIGFVPLFSLYAVLLGRSLLGLICEFVDRSPA